MKIKVIGRLAAVFSTMNVIRAAGVAILLAAFITIHPSFNAKDEIRSAVSVIGEFGLWGAPAYLCFYCVASLSFVPLAFLTWGAGVMLGPFLGFAVAWSAAMAAACIAFMAGRYFARDCTLKLLDKHPRFMALDRAVALSGWRAVFLFRLVPFMPYTMVNLSLGCSGVAFRDYLAGSMAGSVPFAVLYVVMGSVTKDILQTELSSPGMMKGEKAALFIGCIVVIVLFRHISHHCCPN